NYISFKLLNLVLFIFLLGILLRFKLIKKLIAKVLLLFYASTSFLMVVNIILIFLLIGIFLIILIF
ncbi:MAG TPA: hypothetical protein PKK61_14340, partial [Defluviitaleaceae bacterium]|nr:hypothetical protein [Defluviitaleaceae bacterium]